MMSGSWKEYVYHKSLFEISNHGTFIGKHEKKFPNIIPFQNKRDGRVI